MQKKKTFQAEGTGSAKTKRLKKCRVKQFGTAGAQPRGCGWEAGGQVGC